MYNLTRKLAIALPIFLLSTYTLAEYDPNNFDPSNAAHWYRKAFALYEEPNDIDLYDYAIGEIELMPKIEQLLEKQQPVIDLITQGTKKEFCDWKFDSLANNKYTPNPHLSDAKNISFLLLANIRYKESRSLSSNDFSNFEPVLQFASHIDTTEAISHLFSLIIRSMTYEAVRNTINRHPNVQFSNLYRAKKLMKNESDRNTISFNDVVAQDIQKSRRILKNYKSYLYSDQFFTKQLGIPTEKLSDDFYKRNLKFHEDYMQQYQSFLDLPYPQACQRIRDLGETLNLKAKDYFADYKKQLRKKMEDNLSNVLLEASKEYPDFKDIEPPMMLAEIPVELLEKCDFLYAMISGPDSPTSISIDTRIRTKRNALQAGIELLIRYHTTKRFPESLPLNSPKDLFSDKPFLIIKTTDGFKLKCQGEDLFKKEFHEYEFTLAG